MARLARLAGAHRGAAGIALYERRPEFAQRPFGRIDTSEAGSVVVAQAGPLPWIAVLVVARK
ncbi:hypothetical protein ACKI2N_031630 [Cupriavidus sp. 30B13]|uniref:hypothetical protein n=1 Tax=Cupriavidus sp. 30B13 TaxID=3384241 RepID=UPI003B984F64